MIGEGRQLVLLHGLTATRRYVVHGSRALPRAGYQLISYDARGHGESEPAPPGGDYGYPALSSDLARVIDEHCAEPPVLAGHSMGCHTAAAFALANPDRVAAAILIGPATLGLPASEHEVARWEHLADGLERAGVEGFMEAYVRDLEIAPPWRGTMIERTRERMRLHRHPEALARALRERARALPFDGPGALERLELPALVVASHDQADPGHPYAVAEEWAARLPHGELISEEPGDSPLAWQGGRLSRTIEEFLEGEGLSGRGDPAA